MKKVIFCTLSMLLVIAPAHAADGVISVSSSFSVEETANRLDSILSAKGMTIFKRVKHSEAAGGVGVQLRPTELIIFGNPKVGSPLMKCQQTIALDLPQKALIWEDGESNVWISYNDPAYLQKRHDVSGCDQVLSNVAKALAGITNAAATE